jgi:serine phosphatase RsbU (regulator of sigma subunit)
VSARRWRPVGAITRTLDYVNAGHVPQIQVRPNGGSPPMVERLTTGGLVIGLMPEPDHEPGRVVL